ncbi:MAG: hypothetical protein HYZ53_29970 [Planctomycetes bacterium]|nr:hypothetical protein [Planctomycetota bacterium]
MSPQDPIPAPAPAPPQPQPAESPPQSLPTHDDGGPSAHAAADASPGAQARVAEAGFAALLTLLTGAVFWAHRDLQMLLLPQEHGRDLLAATNVLDGRLPLRDFAYYYGPLLPFYYAGWFAALGASIATARLGYFALQAATVACVWALARPLVPRAGAFAAATLALAWTFPHHTYNHIGASLGIVLVLLGLSRAVDPATRTRSAWALLGGGLALIGLVKWNAAVAAAASAWLVLRFADVAMPRPPGATGVRWLPEVVLAGAVAVAATGYAFLAWDVPVSQLRLSLGYVGLPPGDDRSALEDMLYPLTTAWRAATGALPDRPIDFGRGGQLPFLFLASLLGGAVWLVARLRRGSAWSARDLRVLSLWAAAAFQGHEFLLSDSRYALFFFAAPALAPLLVVGGTAVFLHRVAAGRAAILRAGFAAAAVAAAMAWGAWEVRTAASLKQHFLGGPRGGVYVVRPEDRDTLQAAAAFVERNTEPGEAVGEFPATGLVPFLAGRRWLFYWGPFPVGVQPTEDEALLLSAELEAWAPRCVLLTNRTVCPGTPPWVFGRTVAPRLGAVVARDYRVLGVLGYGAWVPQPNPLIGQQVMVLWRNNAQPPKDVPR